MVNTQLPALHEVNGSNLSYVGKVNSCLLMVSNLQYTAVSSIHAGTLVSSLSSPFTSLTAHFSYLNSLSTVHAH